MTCALVVDLTLWMAFACLAGCKRVVEGTCAALQGSSRCTCLPPQQQQHCQCRPLSLRELVQVSNASRAWLRASAYFMPQHIMLALLAAAAVYPLPALRVVQDCAWLLLHNAAVCTVWCCCGCGRHANSWQQPATADPSLAQHCSRFSCS